MKRQILPILFLALASAAWCGVRVEMDTVSAQAGAAVAVDVDVTASGTVVGAIQLSLTYDSENLDVASVDWLPSGMAAAAQHAESIDAGAGRIGLAAFAPTGIALTDCTWRLNLSVSASAAGPYDLRIVSIGTPDTGTSFGTDSVGNGESLTVIHGVIEVTDQRAQEIVATAQSNGTIVLSWIGPTDQNIGYRVERTVIDDTPAGEWVVDNLQAEYQGSWTESTAAPGWHGSNYQHDGNTDHGNKWARFHVGATNSVRAEVSLWWVALGNRASNVPVTIHAADGDHTATIDERFSGSQWNAVGTYDFTTNGYVEFGNTDANNYVIVDAVKFSAVVMHPWETVAVVGDSVVSLVDTGVVSGTSYRYRIHTLFPGGDGPAADSLAVTVPEAGGAAHMLTVISGSGDGDYPAGSIIRVEAGTAPGGMVFAAWTGETAVVADTLSAKTTVRMPTNPVSVGATYGPSDGDGDGMNDTWELNAFGSANAPLGDANGDIDGDGFLNREEYRACTDPIDAASLLVIDGLKAGRTIFWQSAMGATYELQWAPMVTGTWITLTHDIPAAPPTNSIELGTDPRVGFYRIVVE